MPFPSRQEALPAGPNCLTWETAFRYRMVPVSGTMYLTRKRERCSYPMRIIAKKTLREFWEHHSDAEEPLLAWYREVKQADWDTPARLKEMYGSASIVGDNRVIFNIKGNDYRLVVKINYPYRVVYIRFVGTHADYDAVDVEEV